MDKHKLYHIWKHLRSVRPWYFFAAAGLSLLVSVLALRANYQHMTQLRSAVYEADRTGGDTSTALTNLQRFVTAHMNTDLSGGPNGVYPPIQLKYTYERLQEAASKASNEQVYTDAQKHCEALNGTDFSGRNRVPCIEDYVSSHGVQAKQIPDALYKFNFVSPVWSPDLAGLSLVSTFVCALLGLALWLIRRWLKSRI